MSGGHFHTSPSAVGNEYSDQWHDEELNELFADLFGSGWNCRKMPFTEKPRKVEFGRTWASGHYAGGLAETLDLWLSGDIGEDGYRKQVERFKQKWLIKRTPKNRVAFYQQRLEEYAADMVERFKMELGGETDA